MMMPFYHNSLKDFSYCLTYSFNSVKLAPSNRNMKNIPFPFVYVFPVSLFVFLNPCFYNSLSYIFLKAEFLILSPVRTWCVTSGQTEWKIDFMCLSSYLSIVVPNLIAFFIAVKYLLTHVKCVILCDRRFSFTVLSAK